VNRLIANLIISIASYYAKLVPDARLSEAIRSSERSLNYSRDEVEKVNRLIDRKIKCLDVGARGGVLEYLKPYRAALDFVLVEPDAKEAARLRDQGFHTIENIIAGNSGPVALQVTRNPANASLLEPTGPIMHYYAGGDLARFEIVQQPSFPAVTLSEVALQLGGALDYVKLDTQGSEFAILRGAPAAKPLFIVSEVSTAALYKGQGLLYDIGSLLHERGYILSDLTLRAVRPRPLGRYLRRGQRASLGLPLHGDAYFMPDWTRPEGRELIRGRERVWAALMVIHGLEEVMRYVLEFGGVSNLDQVRSILKGTA
jgi:FkbM family methyltransferase